jgi:hypothetical protein
MKKLILTAAILSAAAFSINAAAADFPDMPPEHWAYADVMRLVDEGTINGDESGNYNPDSLVTRAEMVKMIGMGSASGEYADVDASHWGYEYITSSGVAPDENGNFRPSEPMTRGDIIELLWQRAGSPSGSDAPDSVKAQHTNAEAAAWGYAEGIMQGYEDGSMGYDSSITRAEAAAVTVRAGILDTDEELLGVEYTSDGTAVKIRTRTDNPYSDKFVYLLDEVPDEVYTSSLGENAKAPADSFKFAEDFSGLFTTVTARCEKIAREQYNTDIKLTFYPSLVWNTGSTYKYRIKCEIVSVNGQTIAYNDLFGEECTQPLTDGMVFYADIESDYAFGMGVGAVFAFSDPVYIESK